MKRSCWISVFPENSTDTKFVPLLLLRFTGHANPVIELVLNQLFLLDIFGIPTPLNHLLIWLSKRRCHYSPKNEGSQFFERDLLKKTFRLSCRNMKHVLSIVFSFNHSMKPADPYIILVTGRKENFHFSRILHLDPKKTSAQRKQIIR